MSVSRIFLQQLLSRLYPVLIWGSLLGMVAHAAYRHSAVSMKTLQFEQAASEWSQGPSENSPQAFGPGPSALADGSVLMDHLP